VREPARYATKESVPRWAPVVFADDCRRKANVIACFGVGLDVDSGAAPRAAIEAAFGEYHAIVHSTWSSTPRAPRWRMIVPTSRAHSGLEYERLHRFLCIVAERAGIAVDLAARDPSRCWAAPAWRPSYESFELDGATLDVDEALRVVPEEQPLPRSEAPTIRNVSAYVRAALLAETQAVAGAGPGTRNDTLNRSAWRLARLVVDGRLQASDFRDALFAAARETGLPPKEIDAVLRSALRGRAA